MKKFALTALAVLAFVAPAAAHGHRHHNAHAARAQAPVVYTAPVAAPRYSDPLYDAACNVPGFQFPSCPGIGN